MDSLNVKNINDEKIFNVIDPNGQGEVVNRIRPISISINQKAETINDETDSTVNLSVYWNDTWKSILDLTFNDSLRQEYGKLVTDLTAIQKDIDMKQYKDAETKTLDFLKYVANLSSKYTAIPETQNVAASKNKFITIKAERNGVKATISDTLLNFMLKKFAKVNNLDYTKANECYRISRNSCIANDIALYFHSPELFQKQAYMTVVKDNKVVGSYKATYDQFCKLASKFDVTPQKLGYSKDKLAGYMKTAEVVMQNIFFDSVDEAKEWQEMVDEKKKEQADVPEGEETETTETTETETKTTMEEGKSESPAKEEGGLARPSEDFASDEIPDSEPRQQEQTGQGMAASRRLNLLKKRALRKRADYNVVGPEQEFYANIDLPQNGIKIENYSIANDKGKVKISFAFNNTDFKFYMLNDSVDMQLSGNIVATIISNDFKFGNNDIEEEDLIIWLKTEIPYLEVHGIVEESPKGIQLKDVYCGALQNADFISAHLEDVIINDIKIDNTFEDIYYKQYKQIKAHKKINLNKKAGVGAGYKLTISGLEVDPNSIEITNEYAKDENSFFIEFKAKLLPKEVDVQAEHSYWGVSDTLPIVEGEISGDWQGYNDEETKEDFYDELKNATFEISDIRQGGYIWHYETENFNLGGEMVNRGKGAVKEYIGGDGNIEIDWVFIKSIYIADAINDAHDSLFEEEDEEDFDIETKKQNNLNKKAIEGDVQEQDIVPAKTETKVYLQSANKDLDKIWGVKMFVDNMDSKDGTDIVEFTKIGLIDHINGLIEEYDNNDEKLDYNCSDELLKEQVKNYLDGTVEFIKEAKTTPKIKKSAGRYKTKVAEMLDEIGDPTPLITYISESDAKEICEELDIPHEATWYKGDLSGYMEGNPYIIDTLMEYISESDAKAIWSQINIGASKKTKVKKQAEIDDELKEIAPQLKYTLKYEDKPTYLKPLGIFRKNISFEEALKLAGEDLWNAIDRAVGHLFGYVKLDNGDEIKVDSSDFRKKNASNAKKVEKKAEETVEEKMEQQVDEDGDVKATIGVGDIVCIKFDNLSEGDFAKYSEFLGMPMLLIENDKEDINKVIIEQVEYPFQRVTINKDNIGLFDNIKEEQVLVEDVDGDEMITDFVELPVVAKSCKIKAIRKAAKIGGK